MIRPRTELEVPPRAPTPPPPLDGRDDDDAPISSMPLSELRVRRDPSPHAIIRALAVPTRADRSRR
ncbi:MAG TPA: hypothetical protein VLT33_17215 [Labilithrix sp.]|nr:hypothetical protein [Labilithrix sp.]